MGHEAAIEAWAKGRRAAELEAAAKPPTPYALWKQAGGGTADYSAERYRELMIEHGLLLRPGDEGYDEANRNLPCGWPGSVGGSVDV